mmetsp:Transcript_40310/g.96686  ORF Transcript_40310/g.96686 Transcript_40310/m.96686 type:complete len:284 (-) Transcript_40310:702-1553(-)
MVWVTCSTWFAFMSRFCLVLSTSSWHQCSLVPEASPSESICSIMFWIRVLTFLKGSPAACTATSASISLRKVAALSFSKFTSSCRAGSTPTRRRCVVAETWIRAGSLSTRRATVHVPCALASWTRAADRAASSPTVGVAGSAAAGASPSASSSTSATSSTAPARCRVPSAAPFTLPFTIAAASLSVPISSIRSFARASQASAFASHWCVSSIRYFWSSTSPACSVVTSLFASAMSSVRAPTRSWASWRVVFRVARVPSAAWARLACSERLVTSVFSFACKASV